MAPTKKEVRELQRQNKHLERPEFALAMACLLDEEQQVADALNQHADPNCRFHNGFILNSTPLILAAHNASIGIIEHLIREGADPHCRTESQVGGAGGRDALSEILQSTAERTTIRKIVGSLLKAGANPNGADSDGRLPLGFAAAASDLETMEMLVDAGANPMAITPTSPLLFSSLEPQVIEWFLKKGRQINTLGFRNGSLLLWASERGRMDTVEFLLKNGADVRHRDCELINCLSFACRYSVRARLPKEIEKALQLVRLLVEAGADVDNRDVHGKTLFDYAKLAGTSDVAAYLQDDRRQLKG